MLSIGYVEICLSMCVSAFWEFWFYNILAEGLFQEQEFKMLLIGYAIICGNMSLYIMCVFILGILVL